MSYEALTSTQYRVFVAICEYMQQHDIAPSFRDITAASGVKHSQVSKVLGELQAIGLITRTEAVPRSISLRRAS